MNTFWEERFAEEGRIWGDTPSKTVEFATGLFKSAGVQEDPCYRDPGMAVIPEHLPGQGLTSRA